MGYRSGVWIAMNKPCLLKLIAEIQAIDAREKRDDIFDCLSNWCSSIEQDKEGNALIIWSGVKWYDSYPAVNFINAFVDEITSNEEDSMDEPELTYIRIGEDDDDVEQKYTKNGPMFDMHIQRDVSINAYDMESSSIFKRKEVE